MQALRLSMAALSLSVTALAGCGGGAVGGSGGGGGVGGGPAGFTTSATLASPGSTADSRFGSSIALCDWDGDGRKDMFVGMPGAINGASTDAGKVLLFLQAPNGTFPTVPTRTLLPTNWAGGAAAEGAQFGETLECGDFDGDGRPDLVIGAPGDPVGPTSGAGQIYLLANNVSHTGVAFGPYADPNGAATDGGFGSALAVGRVNLDAYDDLAVGAPGTTIAAHPGAGRVSCLTGSATLATFGVQAGTTLVHTSPSDDANFGAALVIADFDGGGLDDVAVGVPGQLLGSGGEVRIYHAFPAFTLLRSLSTTRPGSAVEFGSSLAAADLDQDGDIDLLVGAPYGTVGVQVEAGYVVPFLNTAPASGTFAAGSELVDLTPDAGAQFGAVILVPGDLNGDAYPECVIAAPAAQFGATPGAGTLTLYRNAGHGAFVAPTAGDVYGAGSPTTDGAAGAALAAADLDNDTVADLVVGAPGPIDPLSLLPGQVEVLHAH